MNDKVIDWTLILILSLTAYWSVFGVVSATYHQGARRQRYDTIHTKPQKTKGERKDGCSETDVHPNGGQRRIPYLDGGRINSRGGWWVNRGQNVERKEQDVQVPHVLHWAAITVGLKGHTWEEQTMACTRDSHGTVSTDCQSWHANQGCQSKNSCRKPW